MNNLEKKTLLLTNDDGYLAPGLTALADELSKHYDVYIVAPDRERSAISMTLTINRPLRLHQVEDKIFTLDGTPTDCINIALQKVMPKDPDFIVSGMNQGENIGEDVFFSGTVAGAFAGHIYGIPSLAVSMVPLKKEKEFLYNYKDAAQVTHRVLKKLLPLKNNSIVYNLNIPYTHNDTIMVTSLGMKRYKPSLVERIDPRGRTYFWIGSGYPTSEGGEGSDLNAAGKGYISLSVLKYDLNEPKEQKTLTEVFDES